MVRRIPLRLEPGADESLASYVDRLCVELDAPRGATLARLGLSDNPRSFVGVIGFGAALEPDRHRAMCLAAGLEPEQVDSLLLRRYDGSALDYANLAELTQRGFRDFAQREWAHFSGSNACPACLRESGGIWKVSWKLPWTFACLEHESLLAHSCPKCRRRLASGRETTRPHYPFLIPTLGTCTNQTSVEQGGRGHRARPCGFPLVELDLEPLAGSPRVLEAQRRLSAALESDLVMSLGEFVVSRDYFRELRALCAFVLAFAQPEEIGPLPSPALAAFTDWVRKREARADRRAAAPTRRSHAMRTECYRPTPRTTELVVAIAPFAQEALDSASVDEFVDHLEPVIRRLTAERRYTALPVWTQQFAHAKRLELAAERLLLRRSHYSGRASVEWLLPAQPWQPYKFSAAHVPQLFWRDVFERDLAAPLAGIAPAPRLRRFLSMALVMLAEPCSWRQAADALDLPLDHHAPARLIAAIREKGRLDLVAETLHEQARRLDEDRSRIDYAQRRRMFARLEDIDPSEWFAMCLQTGLSGGEPARRRRYAAAWLWADLTQSDPALAPSLSRKGPLPSGYEKFVAEAPEALLGLLRGYGTRLLVATAVE